MSDNLDTTRGAAGRLRLAGQPDLPVTVLLRHGSADAALVRLVVLLDAEESVEIAVERALLTAGVRESAADGSVRVHTLGNQVAIEVDALTVLLGLGDLVDFLLASFQAVPTGGEHDTVIALTQTALELSQA
jgi:hypothetical protein